MLAIFYSLYFKQFKSAFIDSWYVRLSIRLSNYILPIYFKIVAPPKLGLGNKNKNDKELFIVSLTTFPVRINKVWLAIETILRQTEKPDKVILWLYSGEFNGKASLPKNLLRLEKSGLEIRFCEENLIPHKKYFYTMQEFPDANVITIDDDMFYPPDLIQKLKKFHKIYPKSIICPICRQIKLEGNGFKPYKLWPYLNENTPPEMTNLTIGAGGSLFPSGSLHQDLFNLSELKEMALSADDLWLKVMSLKKNTKVVSIAGEYPRFFIPIIQKNNQRLMDSNIGEGHNDKIFKNLMEFYNISNSVFKN